MENQQRETVIKHDKDSKVYVINSTRNKGVYNGQGFSVLFQRGVERLISDDVLKGNDRIVLLAMVKYMTYHNYFKMSVSELAGRIGKTQQVAARSVKKLIECDYLRLIGTEKQVKIYMVDPNFAYKGNDKQWHKTLDFWEQLGIAKEIQNELD
ncbi:helix-turn-helix domain-containing protein [Crocosphaera sp. Alani8]|uniref:helix-turn-helix domain-containing protein n=1 Tax=Crocosphaera sp. Alani8 TaxID=3038952 RepID=UPI00313DA1D6